MNVQDLFARIGEQTKMPFTIHPHMLRHTCGYAWRGSFFTRMLGFRISRGAIANTGRASAPELLQPQFIDQQRLNDDRAFSNEPRPKPCMANELSEQFQIGIRREEHIYATAGCEPVAGLIKQ